MAFYCVQEILKNPYEISAQMSEVSKVVGYKIDTQKSIVFLDTSK